VRWEQLFEDLESQLEAAERADFDAEVSDRTRRELALVRLADRLRHSAGRPLDLGVAGVGTLRGTVLRVGPGWLLLDDGSGHELLVLEPAILTLRGLPVASSAAAEVLAVAARIRIGQLLRGIARDRSAVVVVLRDGSRFHATIDRVGADFIDLVEHPDGEIRRPDRQADARTVSVAAISVVQTG
jgi:hypothetical protein